VDMDETKNLFENCPDARLASPEEPELTQSSMRIPKDERNAAAGNLRKGSIKVIGGGLAGTEAAWQLANALSKAGINDYRIQLFEMRPQVKTPVHHTSNFAELVCSNSLGSEFLTSARGLLIKEMGLLGSLIIREAKATKVPAGQALAVDRDLFAQNISSVIEGHPLIEIIRQEFDEDLEQYLNSDDYLIIASGPLTSKKLAARIQNLLAKVKPESSANFLHFFDAASPILTHESINQDKVFKASRYDKGGDDYINCAFYDKAEFENFYNELIKAERIELKDFEKESFRYFAGCMPIEAIADSGLQTLLFGPLKPVGLRDPRYPERKPVAVVQLRQDNVIASLYNIVGFQTNLKWSEQKRVFSLIPGLENVDIVRYGVMHQNIFINSPEFLNSDLSLKGSSRLFFAGQITGVEGYTESAASGIVAATSIVNQILGSNISFSENTMIGALMNYISKADPKNFQPINSNWGLLNNCELEKNLRKNKALRQEFFVQRSLDSLMLQSNDSKFCASKT